MRKYLIITFVLFSIFLPVSAEIVQFWPGSGSIGSTDVRDITDGTNERVIFATTNGISIYDNTGWEILHALPKDRRGYLEGIPLDDYVLEIEYDNLNNMWLGYSKGLQIYNGYSKPVTISQPDEILIDVSINKLKSQGDSMWLSTGNSGLYCYREGIFTWVRPGEETGLMGHYIVDMDVDYANDRLYVTSSKEGQYSFNGNFSAITFNKISDPLIHDDMTGVVSHSMGGVVFFNSSDAVHYSEDSGSSHIFNVNNLSENAEKIVDISTTKKGGYIVGTDDGLIILEDGNIRRHITRFDGLGDDYVERVYVDNQDRYWFVTEKLVGYYYEYQYTPVLAFEIKPTEDSNIIEDSTDDIPETVNNDNLEAEGTTDTTTSDKNSGIDIIGMILDLFNL